MNMSTRYLQVTGQALVAPPMQDTGEQNAIGQSSEINRLLTAAVVNRRFCQLLLTNPLAALALGYRGESFQLNPEEVRLVSTIHATSLRDFASQLLKNAASEVGNETRQEKYPHPVMMALPINSV